MSDVTLPTKDEILQLPRWARVAFAARCARRALPLFLKHWPDAPQEHLAAVKRAVIVAEEAAAHAVNVVSAYDFYRVQPLDASGLTAPNAVAIRAALEAARVASSVRPTCGADNSAIAAAYAASTETTCSAVRRARAAGVELSLIRREFQQILSLSQREQWTDDTHVPQSVFDPIEDEPKPPAEVVDTADPVPGRPFKLIIDAYTPADADPQDVRTRLVGLFRELNDYSLLKWGKGLSIDEFRQYLHAGVPEVVS